MEGTSTAHHEVLLIAQLFIAHHNEGGLMARILHTSLVAPWPAGPDLHERSLPLTYLDAMWLQASPVQRVLFYPDATGNDDVLSNLKDSLSKALRAFYPLAGRLRLAPGAPNRHEIHYRPGDGVTFTVAEYQQHAAGFDELAADGTKEVAKIAPLMPPLPPEGGAVLALQATVLRGGLALGVTVHHAACDGASSTHFLRAWASAAAGAAAPEPPVIGRTFIRDRDEMYDAFAAPRPVGPPDDDDGVVVLLATFTLSREHLHGVKDAVAHEAGCRGAPPPRATSTVAAFGFIWQCYLRAAAASSSPCNEGRAYFLFCADHRARLEPRVPDKCLGPCLASASRKEVITGSASGLFTACAAIAASIGGPGPGYWDGWMERVAEAYTGGGGLPLTVAGSPRFRVYDMDFGFGRPVKVDVVSVATDGAISVAEARGGDAGGVEVGISLPADGMDRFRKCFGDAIAWLPSAPQFN